MFCNERSRPGPLPATFSDLLPDMIFHSLSQQGYTPNGALFPLSSYENRVYEVGLEEGPPVIAKYYRPGRWPLAALKEEHDFMKSLLEAEVEVIAPIVLKKSVPDIATIGKISEYHYAFFPKFRGREHADLTLEDRTQLGQTLARLHNVGSRFQSRQRTVLNPDTYGYDSLDAILEQEFLPEELRESLEVHLEQALALVDPFFHNCPPAITVHGDCHLGNVLWNPSGPHLVDFDDMLVAPAVQDVWMLFHGNNDEIEEQRDAFFEGYETFRDFDYETLILTEPLRTLRMIHHAAWIGKRYNEPTFQKAFPYYPQQRYWEEFLLSIKEQISLLQEIE